MSEMQRFIDTSAELARNTAKAIRVTDEHIRELNNRVVSLERDNRLLEERIGYLERAFEYHTVREHEGD